jgi:hypothetical protein
MVGAGIGGGFANTNELHTVKYDDAMSSKDRPLWIKAVEEEFSNMTDHGVFEVAEKSKAPVNAKVLSTTWVMNRTNCFVISGRSDAEYASDPETRRSVSGGTVFLSDTVIFAFSRMQKCVTLSVTEAEFVAAVEVVQNMLFACRVLESIGLHVQKPMVIEVDNKGAVDLANSWTATGRTRHIATRINFLRELKEQGTISVRWISNVAMSSDIFTKNVGGSDFFRHRDVYVREDPSASCVAASTTIYPAGEGVGVRVQPRDAVNRGTGSSVVEDDRIGSSFIEEHGMTQVAAVDFQRDEG